MPFNELIIYVYVVYLSGYISVADWLNNYGRVTPQHSPWINGLLHDSAKPLPLSVLTYHQLDTQEHFQWNFNQKSNIFIQGNTFENVVCQVAAILFRRHVINYSGLHDM